MSTKSLSQSVHVASISQRRGLRVLHTLIDSHNLGPGDLDMSNELSEVSNCSRVEEVHHSEIPTSINAAVESVELLLWRGTVGPEPVFDIHAPVDNVYVGYVLSQFLSHASADCSEWGSEVRGCLYC